MTTSAARCGSQMIRRHGHSGGLFIAMELLAGESLGARLSRGPLTNAEASEIALQTLAALEALHTRGLIHRDLKPSNLFRSEGGERLLGLAAAA